ncbi:acyl carrier protein [Streptomyces sp. NBC_00878]|uniref:acyl carrier protein n=1 Tax=Streptomyces sp. NBC_00878 TaxID=2975854 RepID=UPI00224F6AB4|nr:acyl carrier protein [Streptomyces sp. NBC_00878]MCX4910725.1 acyl carrier protein [Streptomyces sp. NBC_00878]
MSADRTAEAGGSAVEAELCGYLAKQTGTDPDPDQDLFESGAVPSLFAMQLIVHLERRYGIRIVGEDLRMDNFRTVARMTNLVIRLRGDAADV